MMSQTRFAPVGSTLRAAGLLAMLVVLAGYAGAADRPRPTESGQAAADRRAVAALLPRLNADIAVGAWVEGTGVLMTPSVTIAPDGRLEVHGLVCRGDRMPDARFIDACRRGQAAGRARVLLIEPAGIDSSSIRIHQADNGSVEALFACRGASSCVTLPELAKSFIRSSLICNDVAACNRVVINLASLVDLAAPSPVAADPGLRAVQATLKRMISHIRRGYMIRRGTTATVMLNPSVGLRNGDSLEVQRVDCSTNVTSVDDLHLISDCVAGRTGGVTIDKRTISIDVAAIDPQSLRVVLADGAGGAKGSWVAFGCRSAASCVSGTDPSESHRDGRLVCNDQPDCRHLVDDLGGLIQLVAGGAKAGQ
jgi:hypothetical protein